MKFKDPKTGELFDSISAARHAFCDKVFNCVQCPVAGDDRNCFTNVRRNPVESARLMGYEIMDEEGKMEKENKPRLAEVLGVEVGERFTNEELTGKYRRYFWIDEYGEPRPSDSFDEHTDSMFWILRSINHPESIIRAPRLTEPEIAIMRAVGAKWVSLDDTESIEYVYLWDYKPIFSDTNCEFGWDNGRPSVAQVLKSLFPSVEPGDCLSIDGGDADGD